MLKSLKFVCILLVMLGCKRREYAHFQRTATENFHQPKKQESKQLVAQTDESDNIGTEEYILLITAPATASVVAGVGQEIPSGNNQLKEKTDLFPKWLFKKKKRFLSKNKKGGLFQKQEKRGIFEKKKTKKKHKGFGHGFNERLKIGLVLLGIAVVFALLHINLLAIIFGLLSAFFIIRGLRKLF
ncbi:hypothetical protein [Emticicia agri]|uniref:Lipoprotein n=1 Tax=Emticicia agri TaxID=2492393 RepID=A0A4Q5M290_9BACT|nr:hypothetical protein [Emticicia agri]RYU96362.1 hypothetical protein EWM59_07565 [Emticicia agri]